MPRQQIEHQRHLRTVVGAGFIALDIVKGASGSYQALGGSAGNVVAILTFLGWHGLPVGFLGADQASQRINDEFHALGAETGLLRRALEHTTPVVYQTIRDGRPSYSLACPVCGKKRRLGESVVSELIEEIKQRVQVPAVYYFDRANAFNASLAEHFRELNGLVIFEPSAVGQDAEFQRCLSASHVVKYAKDRIEGLSDENGEGNFVEIQTLGAEGLRFRMPRSRRWVFMQIGRAHV